jgi:hypothetical protein
MPARQTTPPKPTIAISIVSSAETTHIMPLPALRLIHRKQSTIALTRRRLKFDGLTDRKADQCCPDLRENRKAFQRYLGFVRIHQDYIPHIVGLAVAITHLRKTGSGFQPRARSALRPAATTRGFGSCRNASWEIARPASSHSQQLWASANSQTRDYGYHGCRCCVQCDIKVGTIVDSRMSRVAPPRTNSRNREWP